MPYNETALGQMKRKANEWWDGLEESQKSFFMDEWILAAYKELIED
jgi:hypothetical protein